MTAILMNSKFTRLLVMLISIQLSFGMAANVLAQRSRSGAKARPEDRSQAVKPERRVDDPGDEEDLNRELWEFARRTPYKRILPYVAAAQKTSKGNQPAEVELPNGWRIAPAGRQVEVGKLPFEAVQFAGKLVVLNTGYYYKEPQEVSIVDPETASIEKTLKFDSLFPSAVVGMDGDLYISGGFSQKVIRLDKQFKVIKEYLVPGFTGGLSPIDSQHLAVSLMAVKDRKGNYLNGKLAILNTESGKLERQINLGYFPFAVRFANDKIFITLLGENKLLVFRRDLKLLDALSVGITPQEMCTDGRQLYVVNTGSDSLSVIDTKDDRVQSTISVGVTGSNFGAAPSSCAVDSNRLYVTLANNNSILVLDRDSGTEVTQIPTGWYPTKVIVDKDKLVAISAKGIRPRRPNPKGPAPVPNSQRTEYALNLLKGSAAFISLKELQAEHGDLADRVKAGVPLFDPNQKLNSPIKHVFYVIKENRTYDQVLGDLGKGNGDPKLTLFGESVTPIQHQLAREFVTLDNFFVNGEISVLGHSFTTSGYASPFIEWLGNVSYSGRWKGDPFGTVPATMSPVYLWDLLDDKKIDYRIYGENSFLFTRAYRIFSELYGPQSEIARRFYGKTAIASAGEDRGTEFNELARTYFGQADTPESAYKLLGNHEFVQAFSRFLTGDQTFAHMVAHDDALRHRFADYLYHYPFNFRSWDLKYSDLDRVTEWKKDFLSQLRRGDVAQLNYIWLPNDHTDGSKSKILNPFQFAAQNDAAVGRLIEIISHSPVWKDSLILIVEDDAQNGPDHVDATRTTAYAVGPYVKRGAVVSDRYDQLSMLRTIELTLGLKSLNSAEQLAAPMFGIFTETPDTRPFVPVAPSKQLADADHQKYQSLSP